MQRSIPLTRDLVLIGGGHTHALVLRHWGMNPLAGVRVTVINPHPTAPYTGMLPGYVAGHYQRDELEIDLVRLARFANTRLIMAKAVAIDPVARLISVEGRTDLHYDLASVDIGITTDLPELPGFLEHAQGAKPLGVFAVAWDEFVEQVSLGALPATMAVIGGGVAGVELALAMAHRLQQCLRQSGSTEKPRVTLLEAGDQLMRGTGEAAQRALLNHLARLSVTVKTGVKVTEVQKGAVCLAGENEVLPAAFVVGAAGARPHAWLENTGLSLNKGFITVDPFLRSVSHPDIYACGDCADLAYAPRPKAGVFAVRQAPVLLHNLRADLSGGQRRVYQPQIDYLKLISTGGKGAVADKFALKLDGAWLWRWKDWIDQRFMDQFAALPKMQQAALPEEVAIGVRDTVLAHKPLCGACGAKVSGGILADTLRSLPLLKRADVLSETGDDAAILRSGSSKQVVSTDHLRAFTQDPWLMARITAIHALGDIWAMAGKPQAVLVNVILPPLDQTLQKNTLREIMQAANEVFSAAGAAIVGGHTTLGAELTLGFMITGEVDQPVLNQGAQPGDQLILTKPIGTGVLLAAEMQYQAQGGWVQAAYESMQRSLATAADVLGKSAHAMTDVTGFGLAGHLAAMMRASGTTAYLKMHKIPLLAGAEFLAAAGVRSSLWESNRALVTDTVPETPQYDLLFDPQTAGGLLATVPASAANDCLMALQDAGEQAAIIGEVRHRSPWDEVSELSFFAE